MEKMRKVKKIMGRDNAENSNVFMNPGHMHIYLLM